MDPLQRREGNIIITSFGKSSKERPGANIEPNPGRKRQQRTSKTALDKLGASVCEVTRDQKGLDLTALDMGCNRFRLNCGCDSSGYYRVAHGTALILNETQFPCQTLVAGLALDTPPSAPMDSPPPQPGMSCSASDGFM